MANNGTISNQATLNYNNGSITKQIVSNTAIVDFVQSLSVEKTAFEDTYMMGETIVYVVTITNTSNTALQNLVISDNLGTYTFNQTSLTPLTYVGPAKVYQNNTERTITPDPATTESNLIFKLSELPANSSLQLTYKAEPNAYAPFSGNDPMITNIVTVTADGINSPAECDCEMSPGTAPELSILKSMSPNPVIDGNEITYTFTIENSGNAPATDVVLTDVFNPAPTIQSIKVPDGFPTDYEYTGSTFTYPDPNGTKVFSVPAANVTQRTTGEVVFTPSEIVIQVIGIL